MKYRSEIDGLRAFAVIPVIFFHAGFLGLGGGFLGVDVFFTISGFLITSIILDDLDKGQFSLSHFYVRRIKRILPSLFVVLTCSTIAALLLFTPVFLKSYSESLMGGILILHQSLNLFCIHGVWQLRSSITFFFR